MKPSLVLWDWNGTLLDDVALCVDALNRLLRIYHSPWAIWKNRRCGPWRRLTA